MKTRIEFRSSKFPPYEGEEEEINPGLWGKRLAEYLAKKLSTNGIKTQDIVMEDWGCYLPIHNEGFRLSLCCGHQYGDDDQFVVFTDPSTAKIKKLIRTVDATPQLTHLLEAVRQMLESEPDIREVVWSDSK